MVALQEVRWKGRGEHKEGNMTLLYSGNDRIHTHGVGFLLGKRAMATLLDFKTINDRLATIRLRSRWFNMTIINGYAPTDASEDQQKNAFYEKLQEVIDSTPRWDVTILLGDFNAKIGKETHTFAPAITA